MSIEKNVREAYRWLDTAEDDLDSAVLLKNNKKYAHACFHSQQAAEKSIKALWYFLDADPWGHSIIKLVNDLKDVDINTYEDMQSLEKSAKLLDRFYIPTRYPNGLPDITPREAYMEEDAEVCIKHAEKIIKKIKSALNK